MVSSGSIRRLRRHAGLEAGAGEQAGPSLAECVEGATVADQQLNAALDDVIDVMVTLNVELNGAVPSEAGEASGNIPRELAYAVAEITRLLRSNTQKNPEAIRSFDDGAWLVEAAWAAVLAGDIDDLREHLRAERTMRSS